MKKHLILALAALSANVFAQSTMTLKHVESNNAPVPANSIIYLTTAANHDTQFNIDVTNTGTATNSYNVKRYDVLLNNQASAYFCFGGNCYASGTYVSPNPLTLNPGQSASSVQGSYNMLTADLDEGPAAGISHVKYTFINTSNPADSVQFTAYYNVAAPTGIKENSKTISSFDIFPNPANDVTSLLINSPKAFESSIVVFNSIGEIVYQKSVSVTEGRNKIDLEVGNLTSGVYFASLKTGNTTISKKLIIN